mmetsp:Transcript_57549/g.161452  ORF Transcript_57549/g.161452 Transcript_57549/m.161452 type:complete len:259 (+) Transcript_57549:37-813(+)
MLGSRHVRRTTSLITRCASNKYRVARASRDKILIGRPTGSSDVPQHLKSVAMIKLVRCPGDATSHSWQIGTPPLSLQVLVGAASHVRLDVNRRDEPASWAMQDLIRLRLPPSADASGVEGVATPQAPRGLPAEHGLQADGAGAVLHVEERRARGLDVRLDSDPPLRVGPPRHAEARREAAEELQHQQRHHRDDSEQKVLPLVSDDEEISHGGRAHDNEQQRVHSGRDRAEHPEQQEPELLLRLAGDRWRCSGQNGGDG